MGTPSRLLSGLATVSKEQPLGSFPFPDPFHTSSTPGLGVVASWNDFVGSGITGFTIAGVASALALSDGVGGFATLTPGAATTASSAYLTAAPFQFQSGNKFWFLTRFGSSAVTGIAFYAGLIKTGATATDSLLFSKAGAGTGFNLVSTVNSTATTLQSGLYTPTAGGYTEFGLYFDGTDLHIYTNGVLATRVYGPTIGATGTTLSNALLTPIFGLTPLAGETVAVDYILTAQEVSR